MNSIFFILLLTVSQVQWHQMNGPYMGYIADIEILDDSGTNLLVCTWNSFSGGMYRSTDGAQTWLISSAGIPPNIGYGLNRIGSSPANRNIVLCGTGFLAPNYVYKSNDGGQHWITTSYSGGAVNDIKFFPQSNDTVILIGSGIYKSYDGGITWALKHTVTNGRALCFKRNTPDTIFAATQLGVLISTNQGETWTNTAFDKYAYDIIADPQQPGSLYVASLILGVFRLRDNGNTYDSLGLGGKYNTTICFDRISRKIYVGGYAGNGKVSMSENLGQTWYEFRDDQFFDRWIGDVEVPENNANKVFAGGFNAGVLTLTPPDSVWCLSSTGINQAVVRSIAVAPADADIIYIGMSMSGVWRSTDAGMTWETNPQNKTWHKNHQTEYWPVGLAISPGNPDVAFATFWNSPDYYHAVLKTTDGGQTWEEKTDGLDTLPSFAHLNWITVHPHSDDTIYLATSSGAFKSTDSGESWVKKSSHHLYWIEIDPVFPNRLYATSACMLYYSEDAGETWAPRNNGLSDMSDVMMVDVDPRNNNIAYAALCGLEVNDPLSGIYRTADYGAEWERRSNGLPGPPIFRPRVLVDTINNYLWATTPLLAQGIYYSTNEGISWSSGNAGLNTNRTMFLALGNHPLLGTQGNGIWYYGDLGVQEKPLQTTSSFSITPNPVKGTLRISYTLTRRSSTKITIIDRAGRVIESFEEKTREPGTYNSSFSPDLPSGIYFLRIQMCGNQSLQKFAFIR